MRAIEIHQSPRDLIGRYPRARTLRSTQLFRSEEKPRVDSTSSDRRERVRSREPRPCGASDYPPQLTTAIQTQHLRRLPAVDRVPRCELCLYGLHGLPWDAGGLAVNPAGSIE